MSGSLLLQRLSGLAKRRCHVAPLDEEKALGLDLFTKIPVWIFYGDATFLTGMPLCFKAYDVRYHGCGEVPVWLPVLFFSYGFFFSP